MRHNFRELNIWKNSMEITRMTYRLTKELPPEEKFGLVSQMRRCAVSLPSNIAEGTGRTTEKEFVHFLNISISSSYELETQLLLINDLFEIESEFLVVKLNALQKMIDSFKRTINKS